MKKKKRLFWSKKDRMIGDHSNALLFGNVDVKKSFREAKKRAKIEDFFTRTAVKRRTA